MSNREIRLLFIVNSLEHGGAEKHVVTLASRINRARFRISLYYLKPADALLAGLDWENVRGGVACARVRRRLDWTAVRALAAHIQREQTDVIVCTNAYSLLYGWLARIVAKVPARLVEVFHTTAPGSTRAILQLLLYRPLFRICDLLVYVSENQRDFWKQRFGRKKADTVVHNGIDCKHFSDTWSAHDKVVLRESLRIDPNCYLVGICAAMRPEKAHLDLIHAVSRLADKGIAIGCLIIGDGPMRQSIEAEIKSLGLDTRVRITGFVDDVRPYMACCDALAIVSHHVETFSISALEAMAMGKPMVMSRIGGADEQVSDGENGFLFEAGDVEALARALATLAGKRQRLRMGECARRTVAARFTIERMVAAYENLFTFLGDVPLQKGALGDEAHSA